MQPNAQLIQQHAAHLEHQAHNEALYKQAYHQRLHELQLAQHATELQKFAQTLGGVEPTLHVSPGRALGGGLMGLGAGTLGTLAAGAAGYEDPRIAQLLMGGGAGLGALAGGLTQPSDEQLSTELLRQQMQDEQDAMLEQYKTQLSGAEL